MQNSKLKNNKFLNKTLNFESDRIGFGLLTFNSKSGQALITLLFFVVVAIIITSAAIIIIITNSTATTKLESGILAKSIAESGAENAILRLLRNPNYSGETLTIGEGTAIIEVTGNNPIIINSEGRLGNSIKKVQIKMNYQSGVLSVQSWKEVQ